MSVEIGLNPSFTQTEREREMSSLTCNRTVEFDKNRRHRNIIPNKAVTYFEYDEPTLAFPLGSSTDLRHLLYDHPCVITL